ncbi:hypothetical protein QUF90_06940 [Desulfococcaceae bacterium HSG9]|nr:hypothetical protein [Desulfococcaceae bacterium HSG9]
MEYYSDATHSQVWDNETGRLPTLQPLRTADHPCRAESRSIQGE